MRAPHRDRTQKPIKFQYPKQIKFKIKGFIVLQFGETLIDQKSQALLVPVVNGGDGLTHPQPTDIATYRLNWPRGQFSEKKIPTF